MFADKREDRGGAGGAGRHHHLQPVHSPYPKPSESRIWHIYDSQRIWYIYNSQGEYGTKYVTYTTVSKYGTCTNPADMVHIKTKQIWYVYKHSENGTCTTPAKRVHTRQRIWHIYDSECGKIQLSEYGTYTTGRARERPWFQAKVLTLFSCVPSSLGGGSPKSKREALAIRVLDETTFNLKLSGNEVYCTIFLCS